VTLNFLSASSRAPVVTPATMGKMDRISLARNVERNFIQLGGMLGKLQPRVEEKVCGYIPAV
jgi:hypothetical protein